MIAGEQTVREVFGLYGRSYKPKPDVPIYEWARNAVELDNTSPISGYYRIENSPTLREPFDAFKAPNVRMVTTIGPNQGGRTKAMEVACLWSMEHRPGPMMWNTYTNEKATDFMRQRLWVMAKNCRATASLLPPDRLDTRPRNFIMSNGMPFVCQGANDSNLQEKSIMTQFNDECYQWNSGHLQEAWNRCQISYAWIHKIWNGSTGGEEGDDIDTAFQDADCRVWCFNCLSCGHSQAFQWGKPGAKGGIKWETSARTKPNGVWNYSEVRKTAYYECEKCEFRHVDSRSVRAKMNQTGFYLPERAAELGITPLILPSGSKFYPFGERVSYRYNVLAVNWPGLAWGQWVVEFLAATKQYKLYGNAEPLKLFWTRRMAVSWNEAKYCNAREQLIVSGYTLGSPSIYKTQRWEGEVMRFMACDKQELYYPYVIRACQKNGHSRLIDRGYLSSYDEIEAVAGDFSIPPNRVLIDSRYEQREVFAAAATRGWTCFQGEEKENYIHLIPVQNSPRKQRILRPYSEQKLGDPMMGTAQQQVNRGDIVRPHLLANASIAVQGNKMARLFMFGNLPIKDILNKFKRGRTGIAWEIPDDVGEDYLKQINSEVRYRVDSRKGGTTFWWSNAGKDGKARRQPNHFWDCEVLIMCAMIMQRLIDLDEWQKADESIYVYKTENEPTPFEVAAA